MAVGGMAWCVRRQPEVPVGLGPCQCQCRKLLLSFSVFPVIMMMQPG